MKQDENIPISEKYMLTIKEASKYFNIGEKKMYSLARAYQGVFSVNNGIKYLIIRTKFEKFLVETSAI